MPRELAPREHHVLERKHRNRQQPRLVGPAEVEDPVVVRAREHRRGKRIGDEWEVLEEQRGEDHRAVDAHRVHVGEAGLGIPCAGRDAGERARIERADVLGRTAGSPDCVPDDRLPAQLGSGRTVQHGEALSRVVDVVEEGGPGQRALGLGHEVVPDRRRLVDVAIEVHDGGVDTRRGHHVTVASMIVRSHPRARSASMLRRGRDTSSTHSSNSPPWGNHGGRSIGGGSSVTNTLPSMP